MFAAQLSYDVNIEARSATPARHVERVAIVWRALRRSPAGRRLGSIDAASSALLDRGQIDGLDGLVERRLTMGSRVHPSWRRSPTRAEPSLRQRHRGEALDRFDEIDRASFADSLERFVSALDEVVAARTQLVRNQLHDKSSPVETARG